MICVNDYRHISKTTLWSSSLVHSVIFRWCVSDDVLLMIICPGDQSLESSHCWFFNRVHIEASGLQPFIHAHMHFTAKSREASKPQGSGYIYSECWQAHRQQRCRDACHMSERYNNYNSQSHDFVPLQDLAVRCITAWWIEVLIHCSLDTFRIPQHVHHSKWPRTIKVRYEVILRFHSSMRFYNCYCHNFSNTEILHDTEQWFHYKRIFCEQIKMFCEWVI